MENRVFIILHVSLEFQNKTFLGFDVATLGTSGQYLLDLNLCRAGIDFRRQNLT